MVLGLWTSNDLRLNALGASDQILPAIVARPNGGFSAIWNDYSGYPSTVLPVKMWASFHADGSTSAPQSRFETHHKAVPVAPLMIPTPTGYVAAWTKSPSGPGNPSDSWQAGRASFPGAGIVVVPSLNTGDQVVTGLTRLVDGRVVIVWTTEATTPEDAAPLGLRARIFAANGTPQGNEFAVNTTTPGAQAEGRAAGLANGGFVVVWTDPSAGDGQPAPETDLRLQAFDAAGGKVGPERRIDPTGTGLQSRPDIARLADGRLIVVWTDSATDGAGTGLRAQFLDAGGTPDGAAFTVNQSAAGNQSGARLLVLADGRFLIAWQDDGGAHGDTSGSAIMVQVMRADGTPDGAAERVNTTTAGDQHSVTLTQLADGRIVLAWTDESNTGVNTQGADIRARILDPRSEAITFAGTAMADDWAGTRFDDSLSGAGGQDYLVGDGGNDLITGDADFDVLIGGTGHDTLDGGEGGDRLTGGAGNDVLDGGTGDDTLTGGAGDDRYIIDTRRDQVVEAADGGRDTVVSASRYLSLPEFAHFEDAVLLGSGNYALYGNDGDNRLTGNAGNNTINGGAGADTMIGGMGDDVFTLDTPGDQVVELAGGGTDTLISALEHLVLDAAAHIEIITLATAGRHAAGTARAEQITGSGLDNWLAGWGGNDLLSGSWGNDTLRGGAGADTLKGGSGHDTLDGGTGRDSMAGGRDNDTYIVDRWSDTVTEYRDWGRDRILTTLSITLGTYRNVEDAALLDGVNARLTGSAAANTLTGNRGNNRLDGAAGHDTLSGGGGNDTLLGGVGNDRLWGGIGADRLIGGTGRDVMTGGKGADIFVFRTALEIGNFGASDRITDFRHGIDHIDLSALHPGGRFIGAAALGAAGDVRYTRATGTVMGDLDGDGAADWRLTLDNAPVLSSADFVF